jgi:NADH-quinone oxidoreductase subunit L
MLTPLVVLAGLALVGGGLNLPFTHKLKFLERWLDPVVGEAEVAWSSKPYFKVALAAIAVVGAVAGIIGAYFVYQKKKAPAIEPALFANAWYVDRAYSDFMGGPGREGFDALAWADQHVIDGAVNGAATGVRGLGNRLRTLQTGYIRNYAVGIGLGAVLLLGWFMTRGII